MPVCTIAKGRNAEKGFDYEYVVAYNGPVYIRHWSNSVGVISVAMVDVGGDSTTLFRTDRGFDKVEAHTAAMTFKDFAGISLADARATAKPAV